MQQYQAYQAQMAQFMAMAMQGQQAPAAAPQRQPAGGADDASRRRKDGSATTLLVKRLPDSVPDGELRKYFAQFGRLVGFEVDRSRHLAFVQFPTPEQAERALKKPKPVVSRRFLTVVMAKGDPLGPPPPATEPERLRAVGEPMREAVALLCEVKEVRAVDWGVRREEEEGEGGGGVNSPLPPCPRTPKWEAPTCGGRLPRWAALR